MNETTYRGVLVQSDQTSFVDSGARLRPAVLNIAHRCVLRIGYQSLGLRNNAPRQSLNLRIFLPNGAPEMPSYVRPFVPWSPPAPIPSASTTARCRDARCQHDRRAQNHPHDPAAPCEGWGARLPGRRDDGLQPSARTTVGGVSPSLSRERNTPRSMRSTASGSDAARSQRPRLDLVAARRNAEDRIVTAARSVSRSRA